MRRSRDRCRIYVNDKVTAQTCQQREQSAIGHRQWRREGGGASAPGPGPVVGARAKLDFFFVVDRKSVGDPGF